MALAWMVSKENSSHCAGGILADDQGLGKTVSTIALILKQKSQQSKFMCADSDPLKSEALNLDEDDEAVTVVDKAKQSMNDEPKKDLDASLSTAASTSDVKPSSSHMDIVPNRIVESKVECKKTKTGTSSASSTMRSMTRPAAGTLVVCPASVLKQWANELNDKVSQSARLSVLVYHGGARTKDPSELAKYDVVVTTYTIVANEVPKQNADDDQDQKNGEESSVGNKRKPPSKSKKRKKKLKDSDIDLDSGPVARVRWFRVVLDEAQTIKNFRTQVAKGCCGLRAKRRWCLSGTPIQNSIDELYSYFRFLKYDPYSTYSSFCTMIKHPIARNAVHGYKKLQTVLRIVLLRRTKETTINGEPIINLPPKTIKLQKVDFTKEERAFYLTLEERSRQQFKVEDRCRDLESYLELLAIIGSFLNVGSLVFCHYTYSAIVSTSAISIACHPVKHELTKHIGVDASFVRAGVHDQVQWFKPDITRDPNCSLMREYAAAGTVKQNYANILLLLLRLRQACDHPLLVKGHQSVFKGDGSIEMAKQLSKERVIDLLARLEVSALCAVCRDTPEDAVVAMCGHIFCYQCIYERITTDENMCPVPNCRNTLSTESVFSSGTLKICISGKTSTHAIASSSADDELSSISQSSYISSKIQATVDILNSIINMHALTDSDTIESNPNRVSPVKAIVFSQWTGMLDLLEFSLNSNLIQYRRLDGTMSLNSRDKAVKDFNIDPEVIPLTQLVSFATSGQSSDIMLLDVFFFQVRVMIMSLKAGNLGLNMVAACHVILLDLWWNPYAEDQAIDRAHRIGQTRPVTVSRLTITDTVEDRILSLQVGGDGVLRNVVCNLQVEESRAGMAGRVGLVAVEAQPLAATLEKLG
uniref:Putative ATP-dependent helicase n=1 Tax=Aegilops tauschii TaxID=37682 RepID=M8AYM2_AEGTA